MLKIESVFFSRKGQKEINEDFLMPAFPAMGAWWTAVADGMGGRVGGDVASATAIGAIRGALEAQRESDISNLFSLAWGALRTIADERPNLASMGTTLSLLRLSDAAAEVGHVGDSRIYHLRFNGLMDRTVDQTEVEELVQRGVLSRGRARRYPRRHVLLSVLSPLRKYDLQRQQFGIQNGDRLLLITDGVSSKMLRREIRDLSLEKHDPKLFCDALADEIEKREPQDDYSTICVDIKEL